MSKFEGTNFLDFKKELLKDNKERQEYERLKPKYDMIQKFIERRNELCLSQRELAHRVGMQQSAIARLENGEYNSTVDTMLRVAGALDLDVAFNRKSSIKA